MSSIKVYVRVRPALPKEFDAPGCHNCVELDTTTEGEAKASSNWLRIKKDGEPRRHYARVWGPHSTQEECFRAIGVSTVNDLFEGYDGCVFVYGQTGTGKTFTLGCSVPGLEGLQPRCLKMIYDRAAKDNNSSSGCQYRTTVRHHYVQLYLDSVQDLLCPAHDDLPVRFSDATGAHIEGVTVRECQSYEEAMKAVVAAGDANRVVATTELNPRSSRSHACLVTEVTRTNRATGEVAATARLHLIDLAGSERVANSGVTGDQMREAVAINQSLTTLGNCVAALANSNTKKGQQSAANSPKANIGAFRESKLTRILQHSLCGNGRTSIIVTVRPDSPNMQETLSTLNFGSRAQKVEAQMTPAAYRDKLIEAQELNAETERAMAAEAAKAACFAAAAAATAGQLQAAAAELAAIERAADAEIAAAVAEAERMQSAARAEFAALIAAMDEEAERAKEAVRLEQKEALGGDAAEFAVAQRVEKAVAAHRLALECSAAPTVAALAEALDSARREHTEVLRLVEEEELTLIDDDGEEDDIDAIAAAKLLEAEAALAAARHNLRARKASASRHQHLTTVAAIAQRKTEMSALLQKLTRKRATLMQRTAGWDRAAIFAASSPQPVAANDNDDDVSGTQQQHNGCDEHEATSEEATVAAASSVAKAKSSVPSMATDPGAVAAFIKAVDNASASDTSGSDDDDDDDPPSFDSDWTPPPSPPSTDDEDDDVSDGASTEDTSVGSSSDESETSLGSTSAEDLDDDEGDAEEEECPLRADGTAASFLRDTGSDNNRSLIGGSAHGGRRRLVGTTQPPPRRQFDHATSRDRQLAELLEQIAEYLEYGCTCYVLNTTTSATHKGSGASPPPPPPTISLHRRHLFLSKDRRTLCLAEYHHSSKTTQTADDGSEKKDATAQQQQQQEGLRRPDRSTARDVVALDAVTRVMLGQFTDGFRAALEGAPMVPQGTAMPPTSTRITLNALPVFFYRSLSLCHHGTPIIDLILDTDTDFEAWVVTLHRLTRLDPEWGGPLDISMARDVGRLSEAEKKLCSDAHILPSCLIAAKATILHKEPRLFYTLFDLRTASGLDLFHAQRLFDFLIRMRYFDRVGVYHCRFREMLAQLAAEKERKAEAHRLQVRIVRMCLHYRLPQGKEQQQQPDEDTTESGEKKNQKDRVPNDGAKCVADEEEEAKQAIVSFLRTVRGKEQQVLQQLIAAHGPEPPAADEEASSSDLTTLPEVIVALAMAKSRQPVSTLRGQSPSPPPPPPTDEQEEENDD